MSVRTTAATGSITSRSLLLGSSRGGCNSSPSSAGPQAFLIPVLQTTEPTHRTAEAHVCKRSCPSPYLDAELSGLFCTDSNRARCNAGTPERPALEAWLSPPGTENRGIKPASTPRDVLRHRTGVVDTWHCRVLQSTQRAWCRGPEARGRPGTERRRRGGRSHSGRREDDPRGGKTRTPVKPQQFPRGRGCPPEDKPRAAGTLQTPHGVGHPPARPRRRTASPP